MQEAGFRSLTVSLRPQGSAAQATSSTRFFDMPIADPSNEGPLNEIKKLQLIPASPLETVTFDLEAPPEALRPSQRRRIKQVERAYNLGLAVVRYVTAEQESVLVEYSGNTRSIKARRTRYDLRLAQWLLTRGLSWQTSGIYGSWQYSFRTFRYIPKDALIVDFCIEGDVANVQKMFDKGLASPFDRVRYGDEDWSLLHVSSVSLLTKCSSLTKHDDTSSLSLVAMCNCVNS